jgi:putative beta-lysine N-acetyltransferase
MRVTAETFFADAYAECDPRAAEAVGVWIETATGRKEVVLDPPNLRVKVLGLPVADLADEVIQGLLAGLTDATTPYTKFTAYAPPEEEADWVRRGFLKEGVILGYFADGVDAHLWARYGEDGRDEAPRDAEHDRIVAVALDKEPAEPAAPQDLECRPAREDDAPALALLLKATFPDYPSPLDAGSLAAGIRDDTRRFRLLADTDGEIVAAMSAEIDHRRHSAEMTDCATRPAHRGRGLMSYLIRTLETDLVRDLGIRDFYSLARADEPGMNCAFAKLGYAYTGRLVNNCRMPNGWESMNVWCRQASLPALDLPAAAF